MSKTTPEHRAGGSDGIQGLLFESSYKLYFISPNLLLYALTPALKTYNLQLITFYKNNFATI